MDASGSEFDEEKHIDGFEPYGFHSEEIASLDLLLVMAHQVKPTNGTPANYCWEDPLAVEYIANRCLGYLEIQLDEFALYLAITSAWILLG
jgi:hypothetical protein